MRHNHDTICLADHRIDREAYSSAQISAVYTFITWYTGQKYVVAVLLYEHYMENNRINLVNTSINQPVKSNVFQSFVKTLVPVSYPIAPLTLVHIRDGNRLFNNRLILFHQYSITGYFFSG